MMMMMMIMMIRYDDDDDDDLCLNYASLQSVCTLSALNFYLLL